MSASVVVVTASIGHPALRRCIRSVEDQTYPNLRHLIAVDGQRCESAVKKLLDEVDPRIKLDALVVPYQTGHSGYFGYRLYGAMPLLVDEDIVVYLDEDNWYEPDHVASCVQALTSTGVSWVYAMRTIRSAHGAWLCDDDCDSLGFWSKYATLLDESSLSSEELVRHRAHPNLVDTSCLALDRTLAIRIAPLWSNRHADSVVATHLVENFAGACTGRSTVNYALGGGSGTHVEWFVEGNRQLVERHRGSLPWRVGVHRLEPGSRSHPDVAPGQRGREAD